MSKSIFHTIIKASDEIYKGNLKLEKSLDAYADGNDDGAANQYDRALDHYDKALVLVDECGNAVVGA